MDSITDFISSNPNLSIGCAFLFGITLSTTIISISNSSRQPKETNTNESEIKELSSSLQSIKQELYTTQTMNNTLIKKLNDIELQTNNNHNYTLIKLQDITELSSDIKRELIFIKKTNDIRNRRYSGNHNSDPQQPQQPPTPQSRNRRALTLETGMTEHNIRTNSMYISSTDRPMSSERDEFKGLSPERESSKSSPSQSDLTPRW